VSCLRVDEKDEESVVLQRATTSGTLLAQAVHSALQHVRRHLNHVVDNAAIVQDGAVISVVIPAALFTFLLCGGVGLYIRGGCSGNNRTECDPSGAAGSSASEPFLPAPSPSSGKMLVDRRQQQLQAQLETAERRAQEAEERAANAERQKNAADVKSVVDILNLKTKLTQAQSSANTTGDSEKLVAAESRIQELEGQLEATERRASESERRADAADLVLQVNGLRLPSTGSTQMKANEQIESF